MFDQHPTPRVFCTPLGVDFSAALIDGLDARLSGQPPHALARVEIFVASDRMRRRIQSLYAEREASFLPRLTPVNRIAERPELHDLPKAMTPLGLRLNLVQLIGKLLDADARLAPRSALYELADSLATLMAEMHEEGVSPDAIMALQTAELASHWQRSSAFLGLITRYFAETAEAIPAEARLARAVTKLAALWRHAPPLHPVLVAGSTGSRGATARFMETVARLPQGAVILPGMDVDMPAEVWARLREDRRGAGLAGEDHPQFRLGRFAEIMQVPPNAVEAWTGDRPFAPERNAWMSLALRPAPVTDAWLLEAPALAKAAPPSAAFQAVTLVEAPSPRAEALAIALRLREAAETGQRATLVTPDRGLARAVTAVLDRWHLMPDDSAGLPLDTTAPGRLLALVADLMGGRGDAVELLAILKHPLTHSGDGRRQHIARVEALELECLRGGALRPSRDDLRTWADGSGLPGAQDWVDWIDRSILEAQAQAAPMEHLVAQHMARTETLCAGANPGSTTTLWQGEAGQVALERMRTVAAEAAAAGVMTGRDYRDLITAILADTELRNPVRPHAGVMIWGALEARVQGADLMILGGLNEGVWPATDAADPWLNRALRSQVGLRLPDRRTGLSAHDFQQAAAAREVWFSRALRDAETETVPSRWLNRLTNLLNGTNSVSRNALAEMRQRGKDRLAQAALLDAPGAPIPRAKRVAPAPPADARPRSLSVTQIEKLIRDPFAIYAEKVLRLRPLKPLRPEADPRLKGEVMHKILQRFVSETEGGLPEDAEMLLIDIAEAELRRAREWPVARHLWLQTIKRVARSFVVAEADRRAYANPFAQEISGAAQFLPLDVTLRGKADRIDRLADGRLAIYDYKSGAVPTKQVERLFNKQLRLEAAMAARGAFTKAPAETARVAFLGLNRSRPEYVIDITPATNSETARDLMQLWARYLDEAQGFAPRRAMQNVGWPSDYEHLARYGEWDDSDPIATRKVGR
ncbi:MAG: double-strand break repair protein AddB [Pseudomonadota bacterium]